MRSTGLPRDAGLFGLGGLFDGGDPGGAQQFERRQHIGVGGIERVSGLHVAQRIHQLVLLLIDAGQRQILAHGVLGLALRGIHKGQILVRIDQVVVQPGGAFPELDGLILMTLPRPGIGDGLIVLRRFFQAAQPLVNVGGFFQHAEIVGKFIQRVLVFRQRFFPLFALVVLGRAAQGMFVETSIASHRS